MTKTENQTPREELFRRVAGAFVDESRANELIDAYRLTVLTEAIEAARSEYLRDNTGTPEDGAYNQAVSDVVAAISALAMTK
ncbi:hypothetical protein AB0F09_18620 [Streptomyces olivaceus]|uniref:hypothetical protein n=1 Tax=Streptomyces olivaceus TaxID=47716 RepID=UPI0033C90169